MAAIVYLDVDDEITSAAARLRLLKDDRIALVLPHGSRLATSRINFRLLAREATNRGKTLEIVTGDASARALAATAGLATHVSVAAFEGGPVAAGPADGGAAGDPGAERPASSVRLRAEPDDSPTVIHRAEETIRRPRAVDPIPQVGPRPPSRTRGRVVAIGLFGVLSLAVAAFAGLQLLPSASITLVAATDSVGPISIGVTAQTGITQPDPVNLLVPATTFSFDVAVTQTFPATGVDVVETPATGEVTFSSLNTGQSNGIAQGSIVRTQTNIEFRTLGPVTLPPAQIGIVDGKFVVIPSTRKVGVEAVTPGLAGNVDAGKIVIVPEGENPQRTLVNNEAPTSGGTRVENPVVQQSDIDAAIRVLDDALVVAFADKLANAADVPPGTTLFPETKALGTSTPTVDPATLLGLKQATFDLGVTATGTVLGVNPEPVSTLADARIRSAVDAGFQLDDGSIKIDIGTPIVAGTTITFPVSVRATETRDIDEAALRQRIRGVGLPQARTILGEFGTVTISVWPDWVTTIPSSDARVTLTIDRPNAASPAPSAGGGSPGPQGSAP